MEFLANDLSFHEQFNEIETFRSALARLMAMRRAARRFGREVYCHRTLLTAYPISAVPMQKAIGQLADKNEQRVAMRWLTHAGPFWDDLRQHDAGDRLECRDEIVTDTAVGEAAFRKLHGVDCGLVSVSPSDWDYSPIEVIWRREAENPEDRTTVLENWWNVEALVDALRDKTPPIRSWNDLRGTSINRFGSLVFAEDCFEPLKGVPFAKSAAERFLVLLGILDRLACTFDADGVRTPEGHQVYQDHFTGHKALFSDSSDKEKHQYRQELTFTYPGEPGGSLFCTWHGKVSHSTLRLHFSWPLKANKPVYIVYAGPKITKR